MALAYILMGLATLGYCLYLYLIRNFNYWRDRNVRGPTPVPMFGNIMESAMRHTHIVFTLKKIYQEFPDEKVVGIYRMTTPTLLIRDPDIVKQVMIKDSDYFADRGVRLKKVGLGANLFHADGNTSRILRNKFTPLFTSGKLKNMFYLINEKVDNTIKHIENISQMEPEQEVYELVQNLAVTTIAACAFGLDIDMTEQNNTVDALKRINQNLLTFNYGTELNMMFPGLLSKIGVSFFSREVSDFFFGLVRQVIAVREGKPTNRNDFMDLILEMRQAKEVQGVKRFDGEETQSLEITEDIMAAQAFVFYAAGYETSTSTMAYVLYHLALNPDIQDKVAAEIKEVLQRHGGEINYDTLKDLIYMDRVFHEVLRLHPQGDPIIRGVTADYNIPGTDLTLRKGQTVLLSLSGVNNDEKYWPNPSKFDPDRFSPENSANRHPAVFTPFGIGSRNCIGIRFAKIQHRLFMAKLLQRFRVEATEHTRREFQYDPYRVAIFPVGGIKMKILPRD